ncbi:hypothetical protein O6H91_Y561400 [Diphasiastrum complanatum]|nr:hypothetical protein O6H91_Y561400 [Diphasiastrum complanatum]
MCHRPRKQLIRALLMIICQLLQLGAKARPLLPAQASSFEERNKHLPVSSVARVEVLSRTQSTKSTQLSLSTHMASETQDLFDTSAQIGSRPPSCQNKCNACNPCLAIQVPTPQRRRSDQDPTAAGAGQIMGEFSNYKPEGWKCKCGSRFFNP